MAGILGIASLKKTNKSGNSTVDTPLNLGYIEGAFVQIRYEYGKQADLYFITSNKTVYRLCGNLSTGLSASINDNGELIVTNILGGSYWLSVDILKF